MSVEHQTSGAQYALGHSEEEMRRLQSQGDYLGGLTRGLLIRAGLGAGMRVLDYGTGAGDVAFVASEIVGPNGEVVGIDRAEAVLDRARARAQQRGIRNVRFVQGDETSVASLAAERQFDAIVGRLVLLHQRDAAGALRTLMAHVRPGGIIAFHEADMSSAAWSEPRLPLFEQVSALVREAGRRAGMDTSSASVARILKAAGVEDRHLVLAGQVEDGPNPLAHLYLSESLRLFLPVMEKLGLTTAAELQPQTLGERLAAEARAASACWIFGHFIEAWGRVPPDAMGSPPPSGELARRSA